MNKTEESKFNNIVRILLSNPNFCNTSVTDDIERVIQIANKEYPDDLRWIPDSMIKKYTKQYINILTELKANIIFKNDCDDKNTDTMIEHIKNAIFSDKMPKTQKNINNNQARVNESKHRAELAFTKMHPGIAMFRPSSVHAPAPAPAPAPKSRMFVPRTPGGGKIRHHRCTHRKYHTLRRNRRISRCKRY